MRLFLSARARTALVVISLLAVLGVAVAARWSGKAKDSKDAVTLEFLPRQIAMLEPRHLSYVLEMPGTVQALSQATVRSRLSAVVQRVDVREGDTVAAGQILAEFDAAPLRAQWAERSANLASAQANLEQAQRTRDANVQLVRQNFITQNAYDAADSALRAQSAAVAAAQAQLAQIQLQIDDAVVRAPIAGQIAKRYVQAGEKLAFDAPLVAIVDLAQLEVKAQAAVSDIARVQPGSAAEVDIEGLSDLHLRGRVERINPSADPGSRSIDLYVSFANPRRLVRAGMFAHVRLHLAADSAVVSLPLGALQIEGGQGFVWVLRDGRLLRRVVSAGRRDEAQQVVEILGGVQSDDRVLAGRFDNLHDGASARIVEAPSAPAAGAVAPRAID